MLGFKGYSKGESYIVSLREHDHKKLSFNNVWRAETRNSAICFEPYEKKSRQG